ncbi:MAG: EscU/YscU/HrcU family type III secretion system export apparatus switch protein, partial [Allorhizobium sp.]
MAEDDDEDSKTEDPTEKKLRDALEKGNVPTSREAPLFATALGFYMYAVFFLPDAIVRLGQSLKDIFERPDQWYLATAVDVVSLFTHLAWEIGAFVAPMMIIVILLGVSANVAQHMPYFVLDRIRPQLNRISLFAGWKRIFSTQGLVEFGKSIFKIVVISVIMVFALRSDYFAVIDTMFSDPQVIFVKFSEILNKMMIIIVLSTALLAAVDVFWTRYHWYEQLRMTKQEVKEEYRQAQGDPIVKARQRSI